MCWMPVYRFWRCRCFVSVELFIRHCCFHQCVMYIRALAFFLQTNDINVLVHRIYNRRVYFAHTDTKMYSTLSRNWFDCGFRYDDDDGERFFHPHIEYILFLLWNWKRSSARVNVMRIWTYFSLTILLLLPFVTCVYSFAPRTFVGWVSCFGIAAVTPCLYSRKYINGWFFVLIKTKATTNRREREKRYMMMCNIYEFNDASIYE